MINSKLLKFELLVSCRIGGKFPRLRMGVSMLLLISLLPGCASIFSQSNYPILIESNVQGANFVIQNHNGIEIARGETPKMVFLDSGSGYFRRAKYNIQFSCLGFEPDNKQVIGRMNGWYWPNIMNGILGYLFVDPATGAMWRLPSRVFGELAASSAYSFPEME